MPKTKKEQLEKAFKKYLMDLIYRVDDGANVLIGNTALAQEYTNKLIKEVSIRVYIGGE